jgi:hypothetical protein
MRRHITDRSDGFAWPSRLTLARKPRRFCSGSRVSTFDHRACANRQSVRYTDEVIYYLYDYTVEHLLNNLNLKA